MYKALVCLKQLSRDWKVVMQLDARNILEVLRGIMEKDKPQLVKVIAQLTTRMVYAPKDMRCWLKFDS